MAKIRINTQYVRDVGRRFLVESGEIEEIARVLRYAISDLDVGAWDGRSRADAQPLLDQVHPRSVSLAHDLNHLGQLLRRIASQFEVEDSVAAGHIGDLDWVEFGVETTGPYVSPPSSSSGEQGTLAGDDASLLDKISDTLGFVSDGSDYWGETSKVFKVLAAPTVSGLAGNWFKDALALSGKSVTRGFGENVLSFAGLGAFGEIIGEAGENWSEYDGDVSKVAIGTAFDTCLGVGLPILVGAAGTFVGSAVGTAIGGPVGTVVGGKIGGLVGGFAGDLASEWVEDIKVGDQELDQAVVGAVAGATEKVGEAVGEGVYNAIEGIVSLF
jgi:uncharacterized protein YukE